ncbi:MAG: hypothetical protein MZU95_01120 [Desulfomicrobium escambiense]|nr:hypothetical protein [Desulfomicrobium escambiense]
MRFNLAQQARRLEIFEAGKVFLTRPDAELPDEPEMIAGLWSGATRSTRPGTARRRPCEFYRPPGRGGGAARPEACDRPLHPDAGGGVPLHAAGPLGPHPGRGPADRHRR